MCGTGQLYLWRVSNYLGLDKAKCLIGTSHLESHDSDFVAHFIIVYLHVVTHPVAFITIVQLIV